jgi:membrane-associated phospholipid phosphatase
MDRDDRAADEAPATDVEAPAASPAGEPHSDAATSSHDSPFLGTMIKNSACNALRDERYRWTLLAHTIAGLGSFAVREIGHPRSPAVFGAGSFDKFFRDAFRSRSHEGNFLDNEVGAVAVPLLGTGLMLVSGNLFDTRAEQVDAMVRAFPLLWIGVAGSSLPTEIAKKSFGRKRPFLRFQNESAIDEYGDDDDARKSFYSGHSSTSFFASTFLDRVFAEWIRKNHPDYDLRHSWGRRLQAGFFHGLAAGVAYSRIDADKHFMTDVLMGAAAGWVIGEATYRFGYARPESAVAVQPAEGGRGIQVSYRF